jgi:hypothetical protein
MQLCRNCESWQTTSQWKGKCEIHPWKKDKYSEDASVPDCPDYVDKYAKYKVATKGGK